MEKHEILTEFKDKVNAQHSAFIIVDVQNDFCADGGWYSKTNDLSVIQEMVPNIEQFLDKARSRGVLTILVKTIYNDHVISSVMREKLVNRGLDISYCIDGTWGAEFYLIMPGEKDIVLTKERHSAFFRTELDTILRHHGIKTVILAGVATNVCVDCTARDAFARDYYVVMLSDCTGSFSTELHDLTLTNIDRIFGVTCKSGDISRLWMD